MAKLPFFSNNEIFSAPVRLLIRESLEIFVTIPRNNTELSKSNVVNVSRRYRSILHECVENLSSDLSTDHADQIKTFKEVQIIWNLCEILLLDVKQLKSLPARLKNWIKLNLDDLDKDSKAILDLVDKQTYRFMENDVPETFWNLVTKLVLRGEVKRATYLLQAHHRFNQSDQLQLVVEMLETMPQSSQYIEHEFCNKWALWSESCKRERETGQFDGDPALLNIVRLLSQDLTVYEELSSYCDSWYQLMVAYLLYTDYCIGRSDLSDLCRQMISTFKHNHPNYAKENPNPNEFDEILISAFEYDLMQVIANCGSYLDDNWWFVTHFVDLLHCSNQLKTLEVPESDKMRETFIQDYAASLFEHEHLWQIGITYLDKCPNSEFYLEQLLSRTPIGINDELRAHKIISIAKKRGLTALSKSVCLLMTRAWMQQTVGLELTSTFGDSKTMSKNSSLPPTANLSNALYWAVKSGDTSMITFISDQYLHYYCKTGTFPDMFAFGAIRKSQMNSERLAFLAKYIEFRQILQNSQFVEAGNLIKTLLASKIYPKFFCGELLEDVKLLLEIQPLLIFRPEQTLDLMQSIEKVAEDGAIEVDMNLRKNLVRNMAKALITPILNE